MIDLSQFIWETAVAGMRRDAALVEHCRLSFWRNSQSQDKEALTEKTQAEVNAEMCRNFDAIEAAAINKEKS